MGQSLRIAEVVVPALDGAAAARVTPIQAQRALEGTFGAIATQTVGPYDPKQWKPLLDFAPARGIAGMNEEYREPVEILMALVALVLLIACTNVAMMVQARNTAREREFSLRLAIGAGRAAIFRQLLCESLLLVCAGAVLGWLFAVLATRALASWSQIDTGLSPDPTVLLFTLAISVAAALTFGIVPLGSAVRAPVAGVSRSTASNATNSKTRVLGGRLVLASKMAVCLVLLMAAGLLLRTLHNYATQNLGMDADELLVFGVTPLEQTDTHVFYRSLLDRLAQLPGVGSVSMVENRPGSGWSNNNGLWLDGLDKRGVLLRSNAVGPGFFHTMGIPIIAGRDISITDTKDTPYVAVVNETFAKKFLADTNPLGHILGTGKGRSMIVGVVGDSKYTSVDEAPMPMAYYAAMQSQSLNAMNIEVRTRGNAMALLPELRKAVAAVYPNIALDQPMTQETQFQESYAQQRMFAVMGSFFGLLAALLVATGLYGTHSFRVNRRTTEIGVRMALGASRAQVLLMVMRESAWVFFAGLAVGIPLTLIAVRPLKSMLYQLSAFDPLSLVIAVSVMAVVAGAAAVIPARRAASIEPMQALRSE